MLSVVQSSHHTGSEVDFTLHPSQRRDAVHCGKLWVHYHTNIQADYQERDFLRSKEVILLQGLGY